MPTLASFPNIKVNTYFQGKGREVIFYRNPKVEWWVKILHLFIYFQRSFGVLVFSNTGIVKYMKQHYQIKVHLSTVKQSMQKLIQDGYVKPYYNVKDPSIQLINGRRLELTPKVIEHLRIVSLDSEEFKALPRKIDVSKEKNNYGASRGRRLVRKKMYTVVDYVNMKKLQQSRAYKSYTEAQMRYFKRDAIVNLPEDLQAAFDGKIEDILDQFYNDIDVGGFNN